MQTNYSSAPNFRAKFFYSDSLYKVAKYAKKTDCYLPLYLSRNNIEKYQVKTRLKLDVSRTKNGLPQVTFTRYNPKQDVLITKDGNDYEEVFRKTYTTKRKINPQRFALEKIFELGKSAPHGNMFKDIVVRK